MSFFLLTCTCCLSPWTLLSSGLWVLKRAIFVWISHPWWWSSCSFALCQAHSEKRSDWLKWAKPKLGSCLGLPHTLSKVSIHNPSTFSCCCLWNGPADSQNIQDSPHADTELGTDVLYSLYCSVPLGKLWLPNVSVFTWSYSTEVIWFFFGAEKSSWIRQETLWVEYIISKNQS